MSDRLPVPAYVENLPIERLRTAEHFLLYAARLWVARFIDPTGVWPDLRQGFAAADMENDGWPAFDALFAALAAGARRTLDIRCLKCRGLTGDEGRLLQAVSLAQNGRLDDAAAIMSDWLPPAAARIGMVPLTRLAQAMTAAGLTIPEREFAFGRVPSVTVAAHPGLALVQ